MGSLNNREIYADKIYSDILFYNETQESKNKSYTIHQVVMIDFV